MEKIETFEDFKRITDGRFHRGCILQYLYIIYEELYKHQYELGLDKYLLHCKEGYVCEDDFMIKILYIRKEKENIRKQILDSYYKDIFKKIKAYSGVEKPKSEVDTLLYRFLYVLYWNEEDKEKQYNHKSSKAESKNYSYGIYGMYEDGELVYVGMTMRPFEDRWKEHIEGIETQSDKLIFYKQVKQKDKIEFRILVDVSKIKSNDAITRRDVEAMELGFIRMFQPRYNYAGRTVEYKFTK